LALLLHLTDLHLDTSPGSGIISDGKVDVIDDASLQKRISTIRTSLAALRLALIRDERELDAIAITGDITHRGNPDGFALLSQLLEPLGEMRPSNDRILIVPGNHDVALGSEPSERSRYEGFLTLRDDGYLTAWLEGVDIDSEGNLLDGAAPAPIIVAKDQSFALVGINSANHSSSVLAVESTLAPFLPELRDSMDPAIRSLLSAWEERGAADIARVDPAQRTSLARELRSNPPDGKAVRVALFHHHLQPVNDVEEIKPFESMLNLSEFQDWLASNDVAVGLHGHKHVHAVRSIRFVPNNHVDPHDLLLICGPSLEEHESNKQGVGILLEFDELHPRGRPVKLSVVPTMSEGTVTSSSVLMPTHHHLDTPGRLGRIEGTSMVEVHRKLLALVGNYGDVVSPLVCHIKDGMSCLKVPSGYPDYTGDEPIDDWFQEIVRWWQNKDRGRAASFNHGERLYSYGFERKNQIDAIVSALRTDRSTTRAVATLVYPIRDAGAPDFPSFTMVHLLIQDDRLNVVAYYRKQEMPHWWPVNVAELATIQQYVLSELNDVRISTGSVTTVTARPTSGTSLPRVAVPWIDREADAHRLAHLVIPLFTGFEVDATIASWQRVFSDWVPARDAESADGNPTPTIGIAELASEIERLKALFSSSSAHVEDLRTTLKSIDLSNRGYRGKVVPWHDWVHSVRPDTEKALGHVRSALKTTG
jgi:3',5'-cyclic AMP phosphodiesterase CpdA